MTRLGLEPVLEIAGYRLLMVCETTITDHRHGNSFCITGSKSPVAVIWQKDGLQTISWLDQTPRADVLEALQM